MSTKFIIDPKVQKKWIKSLHLIVCENLQIKIQNIIDEGKSTTILKKRDQQRILLLKWRIAFNYYKSGSFIECLNSLKELFQDINRNPDLNCSNYSDNYYNEQYNFFNHKFFMYQTAGRCCIQLFLTNDTSFQQIESAYEYFQIAIEHMPLDLYAMYSLPSLLLDLAQSMEYYGSFEAAMTIFTKILNNFPNIRGYFDALYRSAVVGKQLGSLTSDENKKNITVNKCIDILQFLLEAVPPNIRSINIVFFYARTLETSSDTGLKYRSAGVYRVLFDLCKKQNIANAEKYDDFKSWNKDIDNYIALADDIMTTREYLIAKDCYLKYFDEKNKKLIIDEEEPPVSNNTFVKIAVCYAKFQNYSEAMEYAEKSLKTDYFHRLTRDNLGKWNKKYNDTFEIEKVAIRKISGLWKGRCWTMAFINKLREKVIKEMEDRLENNRFDMEAREKLSYIAKNKWRAKFCYEDKCATFIQTVQNKKMSILFEFMMERKKTWIWVEVQRRNFETKANEAHRLYAKNPFKFEYRKNVEYLAKHRYGPRRHPITADYETIQIENEVYKVLYKSYRSFAFRKAIRNKIAERKERLRLFKNEKAKIIQSAIRNRMDNKKQKMMTERMRGLFGAAKIIQRFVRWRNNTFQHSVTRVIQQQKEFKIRKQNAWRVLQRKFYPVMLTFKMKKKFRQSMNDMRSEREIQFEIIRKRKELELRSIITIQRLVRFYLSSVKLSLFRHVMIQRKKNLFSISSESYLSNVKGQPEYSYRSPGIRANTPQFNHVLQQQKIICYEDFSPADCLMLSIVLRNPLCTVKNLVFYNILDSLNPCYEFDFLNSLKKCVSVNSLFILGGLWSENFLSGLIQLIQVDNPRITDFRIENIKNSKILNSNILSSTNRLLLDYFNYSIPGIRIINLHNCSIRDSQVVDICSGLSVNFSLKLLCLSSNLISDKGFKTIYETICSNKKSAITIIDLSLNLIQCKTIVKDCINNNRILGSPITIYIINNLIRYEIDTFMEPKLKLIYDMIQLKNNNNINNNNSSIIVDNNLINMNNSTTLTRKSINEIRLSKATKTLPSLSSIIKNTRPKKDDF